MIKEGSFVRFKIGAYERPQDIDKGLMDSHVFRVGCVHGSLMYLSADNNVDGSLCDEHGTRWVFAAHQVSVVKGMDLSAYEAYTKKTAKNRKRQMEMLDLAKEIIVLEDD